MDVSMSLTRAAKCRSLRPSSNVINSTKEIIFGIVLTKRNLQELRSWANLVEKDVVAQTVDFLLPSLPHRDAMLVHRKVTPSGKLCP